MIPTITPEMRHSLDEQGYCLIANVFNADEMQSLAAAIETHQKRHEERLLNEGGNDGISRASEITFTDHLAERDPEIMKFVKRPEFVSITTQLLGADIDLYWNQSVFKQPEGEKEFPWHQDDGYTAVEPSPYLTLWLALNDATVENGTISVLPGSHKNGLAAHYNSPIGQVCHDADDPDQGIAIPVPAGSMACFWSLTMHKSGVNRSKGIRKAFIIQYSHAGLKNVATDESILDLTPIVRNGAAV